MLEAPMLEAPWTEDQVASLNAYQEVGYMHPFTCGGEKTKVCRENLIATTKGWTCNNCNYTQDWCHSWMADWSWKKFDILMQQAESQTDPKTTPPTSDD